MTGTAEDPAGPTFSHVDRGHTGCPPAAVHVGERPAEILDLDGPVAVSLDQRSVQGVAGELDIASAPRKRDAALRIGSAAAQPRLNYPRRNDVLLLSQ